MAENYKSIHGWLEIGTDKAEKPASDGNTPLLPCRGNVSVSLGDQLIARTTGAFVTNAIEANGDLWIPLSDVAVDIVGVVAPERRVSPDGVPLVMFDPDKVRVEIEDRWHEGADPIEGTLNLFPRWGDMHDLIRLIDVQPTGENRYVSDTYGDIRRNVVEGGQLLAQSLVAAAKAIPDKRVISVHIILSRPAVFDRPVVFDVDVHRSGRQFATVGVTATQDGKPVSSALVLLDKGAGDVIRDSVEMPDLPGPADASFFDFGVVGRASRFVNGDYDPDPDRIGPPELNCWVRHREAPDELYLRQGMLAQSTTHFTIAAAMLPHAGVGEALAHHSLSTGVLAVTLSLHEDPDITDWLLYHNPAIHSGRGLAQGNGRIFSSSGQLIASYSAQVMIRGFDEDPSATGLNSTRLM